MHLDLMKNLANLLKEFNLSEIDYETADIKVSLKKNIHQLQTPHTETNISASMNCTDHNRAKQSENLHPVKAPLIGAFYRATEPGATPFAKEGQKVLKGDPIGLIESMKVLTLVHAPCDGIIEKFLIENGELVEFEEVIAQIAP